MNKFKNIFIDILLKIYVEIYFYISKKYAKKIWIDIDYNVVKDICLYDLTMYSNKKF